MLSDRSRLAEEPTALDRALAERRARGEPVLDLTVVDPSFARDEEAVRAALASEGSADPRAAIAGALARGGVSLAPEAIVPCCGPEDAWARLLWLLADPGDELLVPQPAGPLLARVARDLDVTLAPYPLRSDEGTVDPAAIWDAIGERARAIVVESPSVPAGRYLSPEALEALEALEVPLIVDEQRAAYPLEATPRRARGSGATMFVVDGLCALPEAQLAWIAASGPAPVVTDAVARLARARPPLAAPMARALPALLAIEPRRAVRERAAQNLAMLRALLSGSPLRLPEVEAGWHAPVRLPGGASEQEQALRLLERGVLVAPGARYDVPDGEAWLVLGLLTPPDELARGAEILIELAG